MASGMAVTVILQWLRYLLHVIIHYQKEGEKTSHSCNYHTHRHIEAVWLHSKPTGEEA